MDTFLPELTESLKTGFIDQSYPSKKEFLPQFLVNDKVFGKKILTTIHKELRECDEFWFSVAFVTKSGVATLINILTELQSRGIQGKILVSQYQNFTQPEALRSLLKFSNVNLRIVVHGDFHAKGYLFKRRNGYNLIIGSSNLTANALCANKEWNLKISALENSSIIASAVDEFKKEFDNAVIVDEEYINVYETIFKAQVKLYSESVNRMEFLQANSIHPNAMQTEALKNIKNLRLNNINKALLISATGTGKTYLSAFDVKEFNPKRFLFIVHRANIAEAAMKSFQIVFGKSRSMGMYTGDRREIEADFLFSTIQTISKDYYLNQFDKKQFDYIVIDETHRAGAESYKKILNHFEPKFLLGMTATPERTDGFDIFKQFDYNIAYEIRLHRALEEQMLSTFHYFGVTDVTVDNKVIEEDAAFNLLIAEERIDRIIEKIKLYGCDNGNIRGLVFCSKIKESQELAKAFNNRGYKSISLSGDNSEQERSTAINRLESKKDDKIDYIFTVDIFNEGVDIPKVNQIIMLRPTQSAIVFVQQLGRGLRKADNKEYVTVIDFIGNYNNNYMVPIALYGDTSYNKDSLRKLITSGSSFIPGASTVNFDPIARERIFAAIDKANLQTRKDLLNDYKVLKFKIGKVPMMMDFIENGSRDPFSYITYAKSYYNFVSQEEQEVKNKLSAKQVKLLELLSINIANSKRVEEPIILKGLINSYTVTITELREYIFKIYGTQLSDATIQSCIQNINFNFLNAPENVIILENDRFHLHSDFYSNLENHTFKLYLSDALEYSIRTYDNLFDKNHYVDGFILYRKYSRKDVCRILNWEKDEHSTMYGYKVKYNTCPIFVNYHKEEDIDNSTKYEDKFINNYEFQWMSRSRRTRESSEIKAIMNFRSGLRLPLFIKKSNDEGNDFYYMGDVTPKDPLNNNFEEVKMKDNNGNSLPVVKVNFIMNNPVEESLFEYLTNANT